jgi:hypothetical protein
MGFRMIDHKVSKAVSLYNQQREEACSKRNEIVSVMAEAIFSFCQHQPLNPLTKYHSLCVSSIDISDSKS